MEYIPSEINNLELDINFFKIIIFSIRKNTSFDYGTKVSVDVNSIDFDTMRVNCIGKCSGKKYNLNCSLFEFDWKYDMGDINNLIIFNSNIPYSPHLKVIDHQIVEDTFFQEKFNYILNCKIK